MTLGTPMIMRVEKYHPEKGFGFASNSTHRVFFHAQSFRPGKWTSPPIVGEEVIVTFDDTDVPEGKEPSASDVCRMTPPITLRGKVASFDTRTGWGFVEGEDGVTYYLHRCEVKDNRIPVMGKTCQFVAGSRKGKPRACYVELA